MPLDQNTKAINTNKQAQNTDTATSPRPKKYSKGAMGTKNIKEETEKKT
jgi:hypothetical protein